MFPTALGGGGGTDFSKMIPGITTVGAGGNTFSTALSIQGSGFLTCISCFISGSSAAGVIRVTIDGTVMMNDTQFVPTNGMNTISFIHPFIRSLLIEHRTSISSGATIDTKISYLLN